MAEIQNEELYFEEVGNRIVYSSQLVDALGNQWRIDAIGEPDAEDLLYFRDERPIRLEAMPMDLAEAEERRIEVEGLMEEQQGNLDLPAGQLGALPSLEVRISLVDLVLDAGTYQVTYEIDPPLTGPSHPYYFVLQGQDTVARVNYATSEGTVSLALSGYAGTATHGPGMGGSVAGRAFQNSAWNLTVYRGAGDPVVYSLSGDIVVF